MPWAVGVFSLWIVQAIVTSRCLYADGSHEFIRTVEAKNFVALMWSRHFAFYIFEFPLVIALKLGVTDFAWLRFAFGLGCFLPWPLVLFCCHWLSPKNSWVVMLACAAGYLNANIMAVGEHILAHAFFWPALYAIVFARPLRPFSALILLGSATALLFSYESQIFLCVPLAGLSFWRLAEDVKKFPTAGRTQKIFSGAVLAMAGGLFLAAAGIGLYSVSSPELPENFSGFLANTNTFLFHPGWTLTWSAGWLSLMLLVWWSDKIWNFLGRPVIVVILILALACWGLAPWVRPDWSDPARLYYNRVLDLMVPLLLLPLVLIIGYRPEWVEAKSWRLARLTAVLLMVQSVWQIGVTWRWQQDVGKLQAILSARTGIIPLNSTTLVSGVMENRAHEFDWAWPCLSLALNPVTRVRGLVCAEPYFSEYRSQKWQPFDPLQVETLPQLEQFGFNYSDYAAAIKILRQRTKIFNHE